MLIARASYTARARYTCYAWQVKDKQKVYTLDQYRQTWTKNAPEVVAAGKLDTTEHRACFKTPDLSVIDATHKMPGHVGSWH